MKTSNESARLELAGLDGTNPLGFLAAVGTLAALNSMNAGSARLGWRRSTTWVPELAHLPSNDPNELCQSLADILRGRPIPGDAEARREESQDAYDSAKKALKDKEGVEQRRLPSDDRSAAKDSEDSEITRLKEDLRVKHQIWIDALRDAVPRPELALGKRIDCAEDEFRTHAGNFATDASHAQRDPLDFLAAFGTDACVDKRPGHIMNIMTTPFCFTTGSGGQFFLDTVRQLMGFVTPERIHATLFERWTYSDERLSMRWDPLEDRRYALMDSDPSDTKSRTVWMANLLAYRALVLFPSVPQHGRLVTTAWSQLDDDATFTWPIWGRPVDMGTVGSILQLRELVTPERDRPALRDRGIEAVFRARRVKVGTPSQFKLNFTPARSVL